MLPERRPPAPINRLQVLPGPVVLAAPRPVRLPAAPRRPAPPLLQAAPVPARGPNLPIQPLAPLVLKAPNPSDGLPAMSGPQVLLRPEARLRLPRPRPVAAITKAARRQAARRATIATPRLTAQGLKVTMARLMAAAVDRLPGPPTTAGAEAPPAAGEVTQERPVGPARRHPRPIRLRRITLPTLHLLEERRSPDSDGRVPALRISKVVPARVSMRASRGLFGEYTH